MTSPRATAREGPLAAPAAAEVTLAGTDAAKGWNRRHVLDLDDFSLEEIELVLETTDAMKEVLAREVPRVPALRGTTVVTLFYEASTRTRASNSIGGASSGWARTRTDPPGRSP